MVNICTILTHSLGSHCVLCGAPADGLCADCRMALPRNASHCARCALPLPDDAPRGTLCADCQARSNAFDSVVAPLRYAAPVDDLIAAFKYRHRLPLGRVLAALLADALVLRTDLPALVLPIPATPGRLRERGFNQAGELARWLARRLDMDCAHDRLRRVREASHQRGLGRRARRRNLRGAFAWHGAAPAHIALVDDVMTTGATVEAASKVLRDAGAVRIEVWAVARTPRD